ncbi:prepilin peptidase [Candidatus Falkowbacteria bacterium]|nr:prepilin peptidase [Candidatus Falkowbacteria bacterium]NCT54425.1 prepilin peptidase [Candidatus Falkowbacteria bacterium]
MELFLIFTIFVFGLIFGSFLNCLIWRLKNNESLWGRSYCPKCRQQISWYDNIPLLSFILLKARCRNCHKKISWQYPLLELGFALLFTSLFFFIAQDFNLLELLRAEFLILFLRDFLFIFILAIIFVYDYHWQEVPMIIVWPGIALMIFFSWLIGFNLLTVLIASALTATFFLIQYLLTRGRGLGEGDIWLGALLGARFVNIQEIFLTIFATYIIGSLVAIFLLIKGKKKIKSKVPLGPFLVIGALISLFFAEDIIRWYFSLLIF